MATEIIAAKFDYSSLPDNISCQLIESSIIIKESMKRTGLEIILIGLELLKSKELIEHGQFNNWCLAEFKLSKQMAANFMNVAREYGGKSKNFLLLKPSILYELATPSTPDSVRQQIENKVEQGEKVTVKEIKDLKDQVKQRNNRIKELSETIDKNDLFFKETLQEVQQDNLDTIKQLSFENNQLRDRINAFESQTPIPEPKYEVIQPEPENSVELEQLKEQIQQRNDQIQSLNEQLISLQNQKADDTVLIIQRMKQEFNDREQQYQTTIENLKSKIQNQDDELTYEYDSEFDFNITAFSQALEQITSNGHYDNEQLKYQLQQLQEQITDILDRMELETA